MITNTIVGSAEWKNWVDKIRQTHRLHVPGFAPAQVVLDEGAHLKGLIVPHRQLEAIEEVGHKAEPGQVLFWYGDYSQKAPASSDKSWNAYDVRRNVFLVEPRTADLVSQAELDKDPEIALHRLEDLRP